MPKGPVLIFSAHADDCEFLAGGTVARFAAEGRDVYEVISTNNDRGSFELDRATLVSQSRDQEAREDGADQHHEEDRRPSPPGPYALLHRFAGECAGPRGGQRGFGRLPGQVQGRRQYGGSDRIQAVGAAVRATAAHGATITSAAERAIATSAALLPTSTPAPARSSGPCYTRILRLISEASHSPS